MFWIFRFEDINAVSALGATPIHSCDPHVHSQDGMTFLMVASQHNNTNLAELVLSSKADINQKNEMKQVRGAARYIRPTPNMA